ncbi:MAG TPA: hypothetical protein VMR52_13765 [Dehalococcoidia bacterium]|nr:hypothetical protein [Dehalococcoidia bacterium]
MADDLVLLGTAGHLEARIWRDALAQEGIPVLMRPADPLGPAGYAPAMGDVRVYVRSEHERRARWVMGDGIEPAITVPGEEPEAEVAEEERAKAGD